MFAPTVANTGEPNNPVRNRKARSIPKLLAIAVSTWKRTKMTSTDVYGVSANMGIFGHQRP